MFTSSFLFGSCLSGNRSGFMNNNATDHRGAIELYDSHSCLYIFAHTLSAFTAGLLQEEIQGILKGVKDGRVQQRAVLQVTASVRSHEATGRRINGHTAGGDSRTDASTLWHPLFPTRIKYCKCFPMSLCWYEHKESASRQLYKAVTRRKKSPSRFNYLLF